MHSSAAAAVWRSPVFTAAQWLELEHQALIYKYLMAGVPVPADLLLPIRRSFFHFSSLGYPSYYGRKLDPEPGRCRRTDGKKWRCSKDAHPDSKYCERHMHRTRNRSRKPVEMSALSQSRPVSSNATSLSPAVSSGNGGGSGSFQSFSSLHSVSGGSNAQVACNCESDTSLLRMHPGSYGFGNKDYRYLQGGKAEVDECGFFTEASGSGKGHELDSSWCPIPSQLSSSSPSKSKDSLLQGGYSHLQPAQNVGQQHALFGSEFGASETLRNESQLLMPFFDEWPKTRDSWSGLGDEGSNGNSLSTTTQLSMSIPMPSTNFTTRCSMSPNGVYHSCQSI
ncbi:hypothetical protein J5N97_029558 [Dioscorea zingiberensis]|uniref:Growth-regulating factor n=1 Tax=Dioscorea zingiberensis TaxID=325984 RepID=A0A9D5H5Q6_9LILI|nr:hypothetical protein J5N97_029518 [Dioscorea zingiberensis]KAJ0964436.1 hypothetical protein J5N97_029558 [Dioscorea zingiberensis]